MTPQEHEVGAECETQSTGSSQLAVDHSQIATLITAQYSGLLNLARRKLKDRDLATDLINEAIAITLEHARLGRLLQPESVAGYVFKVSMNLLLNYQRHSDNRVDLRADIDALDTLAAYDADGAETAQIRRLTKLAIESLPSLRDREVLRRFYLMEDDKQSICDGLGLTALQFTQVMSRARQRMKQVFESQGLKSGDFFSTALIAVGIALIQWTTDA